MMQSLRDNMKLIIWITAIVFLVGFGILQLGGVFGNQPTQQRGPSGVIAEINGEPVRYDEFMQTVNQLTEQLRQTRELQAGEDSYIREQAWQTIVRNKLMLQEAHRRRLDATPDEIKMALRVAPPEFIVQADAFKTNGQFDYRKYLAELDNPNSQVPWGQVEALVGANLPVQKLQEQVVAAAKVSEGDVRERFQLQNEKLKIRYLAFSPDSFPVDTSRIGGADIEAYYKAHPEEFTGPEEVKVSVILIPRKPDASDFSRERERLRTVLDMARAQPDSFASLAKTYSEIQSANRGGDPGTEPFFDDMRPTFRRGLADVAAGQVSDILQEERSLHIFKIEKRYIDLATKREKIHYREIAIRVPPGQAAVAANRALVAKVAKDAKKSGIDAVATRLGIRSFTSEYFAYGKSGNDVLQRFPEVETWMFHSKPGAISSPVPTENGFFIFQIADHRPSGVRTLDRMTAEAKAMVIRSLRTQRAKEAADQARAAVLAGTTDAEAAGRFHARAFQANGITRNGYLPDIGDREPRIVGAMFATPVNSWTPTVTGKNGAFIALIEEHAMPPEEEFRKQEPQLRESLLTERRQLLYAEWMQDLRRRATIKDYRDQFFEA